MYRFFVFFLWTFLWKPYCYLFVCFTCWVHGSGGGDLSGTWCWVSGSVMIVTLLLFCTLAVPDWWQLMHNVQCRHRRLGGVCVCFCNRALCRNMIVFGTNKVQSIFGTNGASATHLSTDERVQSIFGINRASNLFSKLWHGNFQSNLLQHRSNSLGSATHLLPRLRWLVIGPEVDIMLDLVRCATILGESVKT